MSLPWNLAHWLQSNRQCPARPVKTPLQLCFGACNAQMSSIQALIQLICYLIMRMARDEFLYWRFLCSLIEKFTTQDASQSDDQLVQLVTEGFHLRAVASEVGSGSSWCPGGYKFVSWASSHCSLAQSRVTSSVGLDWSRWTSWNETELCLMLNLKIVFFQNFHACWSIDSSVHLIHWRAAWSMWIKKWRPTPSSCKNCTGRLEGPQTCQKQDSCSNAAEKNLDVIMNASTNRSLLQGGGLVNWIVSNLFTYSLSLKYAASAEDVEKVPHTQQPQSQVHRACVVNYCRQSAVKWLSKQGVYAQGYADDGVVLVIGTVLLLCVK